MATTYDKASLVMIPSGYKDDKLYSIKPTDGSGDFTFSRDGSGASPATRVNSDGNIEKGRENLLLQSNSFDTTWATANASVTGGQSGYDGSSDAWLLDKSGANGFVRQFISSSDVSTLSVYVKAGTSSFCKIYLRDSISTNDALTTLNLSSGALLTLTDAAAISHAVEDIGSGWYRLSLTSSGGYDQVLIYPAEGDNDTSGTSGNIYIQDAQLESGLVATDYIETTTTAVSAGLLGDMPRLDYSGGASCPSLLLEPSRTNLVTLSEYIGGWSGTNMGVVNNDATSPEGVTNAAEIESTSTNASHYIGSPNFTMTSGVDYTGSMFVKAGSGRYFQLFFGGVSFTSVGYANFDLQEGVVTDEGSGVTGDIEPFENDWYRVSISGTSAATGSATLYAAAITSGTAARIEVHNSVLSYNIWGAQTESGSYPTSYIPTYGSASLRGEDICNDTGLSSIIGQTEGTLLLEISPLEFADTSRYLSIESSSGAGSGWIGIFASSPDEFRIYGDGFDVNFGGYSVGDRAKIALTYKNGVATDIYINGVNKGSVTANTTGKDYSILRIGKATIGGIGAGEFKQVLVFPTALTNAELAALTTI